MFFHKEKPLLKNVDEFCNHGYWNCLWAHLEVFGSCVSWHHYGEILVYNLKHDPKIQCRRIKKVDSLVNTYKSFKSMTPTIIQ